MDKKEAAFSDLDNTIRGKEKRLRDVQALVKASDSAERLLPIQHQYAAIGWKSKKEKFYQEHKVEIDEYNKALRLLYKFYPDRKIPNRTLKAELKELSDDLEALKLHHAERGHQRRRKLNDRSKASAKRKSFSYRPTA